MKTVSFGKNGLACRQAGFTLIELLIVMAILGILTTGLLIAINPIEQFSKAKDAKRKTELHQLQTALDVYYNDNGAYPAKSLTQGCEYRIYDNGCIQWGGSWGQYITTVPKDPTSPSRKYVYEVSSDRQSYWLYASLERGARDSDACNMGNACGSLAQNGIDDDQCVQTCNFALTSPNVSP